MFKAKLSILLVLGLLVCSSLQESVVVTTEFTQKTFTEADVKGWNIVKPYDNTLCTCDGKTVFGGFKAFGEKTSITKYFNSGVDHYSLLISFDLYTLDSWDHEKLSITIDGVNVLRMFSYHQASRGDRKVLCGNTNWADKINTVQLVVPHFKRNFKLQISSTLDSIAADESWGIRDFSITARYNKDTNALVLEDFTQQENLAKNMNKWFVSDREVVNAFTQCGDYALIGGLQVFGDQVALQRNFDNLPDHFALSLNFDLFFIDNVANTDYVEVLIDGQLSKVLKVDDLQQSTKEENICGNSALKERIIAVSIFVPHRGNAASISITGILVEENRNKAAWGIQNLRLTATTCTNQGCQVVADEFSAQTFDSAPQWVDKDNKSLSKSIVTCSGASVFGGFSKEANKRVENLSVHNGLRIFFRLIAQDGWTHDKQYIQVRVDGSYVDALRTQDFASGTVCESVKDQIINYFIDIPHNSPDVTITLDNTLIGSKKYGIRDFTVVTYLGSNIQIIESDFTDREFSKAEGWSVSPAVNTVSTKCGEYSIFGGYNVFGFKTIITKTVENLPEHQFLTLTFKLYIIDTWNSDDFHVYVDNREVHSLTRQGRQGGQDRICGISDSDEIYTVQVSIPHTASTAAIKFFDELNESKSNESWGIRDIVIAVESEKIETVSCIQIFSECGYTGVSQQICDNTNNLKKTGWTVPIKSIYVPQGKQVKIYKKTDFQGEFKDFAESNECLSGEMFSLINQAFNVDVSQKKSNKKNVRVHRQH